MKKIIGLAFVTALTFSCAGKDCEKSCGDKKATTENLTEGEPFTAGEAVVASEAIQLKDLASVLEIQDSAIVTVKGTINAVCKKKGCWMTMPINEQADMRVRFKDYAFFVPLDSDGKTGIVQGIARKEIISVEDQKHYAEDNGDSPEEIAKITEPRIEYSFLANGVIVE